MSWVVATGAELIALDTRTGALEHTLQCPSDTVCTPGAGDLADNGALLLPGPARVEARYYAAPDYRAKPLPGLGDASLLRFGEGPDEYLAVERGGRALVRLRGDARELLWTHPHARIRDLAVAADGRIALTLDERSPELLWVGPPEQAPTPPSKGPLAVLRGTVGIWSFDEYPTKLDIGAVVRSNIGDVRDCYDDALEHDPAAAGRVDIRFTVEPSGNVSLAEVIESDLDDPFLGSCIAGKSMTWRFPASERKAPVAVSYPFVLSPG